MKMKTLFCLLAFCFTSPLFAQTGGNTAFGTISSVNAGDVVQVLGSFAGSNPDNCTGGSSFYILSQDNEDFRNIYAGLLTAFASGREVRFFLLGCDTGRTRPDGSAIPARPLIASVSLR